MTDIKKWIKLGVADGTMIFRKFKTGYLFRQGEQGEMDILTEDSMQMKLGTLIYSNKKWNNMVANVDGEIKFCYSFWREATEKEKEERQSTCLNGLPYIDFLIATSQYKVQLWQLEDTESFFCFGIDAEYLTSMLETPVSFDENGTTCLEIRKSDTEMMQRVAIVLGENGYVLHKMNGQALTTARTMAEVRRRKIAENLARLKAQKEKLEKKEEKKKKK